MHLPFFALLLLVVLIVAAVLLLANRKTRPFMLGMLGIGALLMLGRFVSVRHHHHEAAWRIQTAVPVFDFDKHKHKKHHKKPPKRPHGPPHAPPPPKELPPPLAPPPEPAPLPEATAVIPLNEEGKPPEPHDASSRPLQANRPAWIDRPAGIEDGSYHMVVVSDPYTTKRECDAALNSQLLAATQNYLAARLGERTPEETPVDLAYIRHRVCQDEYTEIMDTSVGPMRRVHVLLEFDEPVARDLMRRARAALVRGRLIQAVGAAAAVLAALGVVFGHLSLTKTKGS